ncbi:MAG: TIGR03905 family TSCPD domain-containing protein [Clostridia bacterium]|nr:TIGR03905 family TSCPD domain-containing protein [Clostridia bacterium]
MFHYDYTTQYTCSRVISVDLDGDTVHNISFLGGCNGNLKAISKLLEGKTVDEIEDSLTGITCGNRPTSCGDQLAKAVRAAYNASQDPDYVPDED